jgi:alpha-D-ribose 1-methylphosphonate 5-triphosphate synthase subunit PhnI
MRTPDGRSPATDAEFVLYHTEGIEAMGFTNHLKLPHYVTFQADLSNTRAAVRREKKKEQAASGGAEVKTKEKEPA